MCLLFIQVTFSKIFRATCTFCTLVLSFHGFHGSFHRRYFHKTFHGSFCGRRFSSTEAFRKLSRKKKFTKTFTKAFYESSQGNLCGSIIASSEAFTEAFYCGSKFASKEAFTEASVRVNNKLEILDGFFFSHGSFKTKSNGAFTGASGKEKHCHESLRESFRHVVDILFKLYIPQP